MAEAKRRTSELKSVTDDKALAATAIGKAAAAVERPSWSSAVFTARSTSFFLIVLEAASRAAQASEVRSGRLNTRRPWATASPSASTPSKPATTARGSVPSPGARLAKPAGAAAGRAGARTLKYILGGSNEKFTYQ